MRLKIATLAVLLATGVAGAQGTSPEPVSVTLGYTAVIDYLGAYVAEDQGFFEKQGIDVTMQIMPNGGAIPPGLLSGSLQIGALTAPSLIQARSAGIPLRIVTGGTYVTRENPNGTLIVREGVEVNEPSDLEGKRIGTGGLGSYFNVLLRQWMTDNGADFSAVTVVEVPFSQMTDVLRSGQIDAATVGHPFWDRIEAQGIGRSYVAYTGEFTDGLLSNIYVATEDFLAEHPDVAERFAAAIEEANSFIDSNPEGARESAAKHLNLPADTLTSLPFSNYRTEVTAEQIAQWNGIMRGQTLISEDVDPAELLTQ